MHDTYVYTAYFYPRSPCGERLPGNIVLTNVLLFLSTLSLRRATSNTICFESPICISIHALLAESDYTWQAIHNVSRIFLSTLSLRRATLPPHKQKRRNWISIHALLAESDMDRWLAGLKGTLFLSTLSLRRATYSLIAITPSNFSFLSTLSLRRATIHYDNYNLHCVISIHALLAESDAAGVLLVILII